MDSIQIVRRRLAALALATLTIFQIPLIGSAAENDTSSEDSVIVETDTSPLPKTPNSSADTASILGDVNGDEKLTVADSLLVLRYVCDLEKFSDEQQKIADFDGNGRIETVDSLLILRKAIGISTETTSSSPVPTDTDTPSKVPSNPLPADDPDYDSGDTSSNGYGDNAKEDSSITVSGTSYSVPAGMTLYVTASSGVTWDSTNTNIATVDQNGLILAKKAGTVKIIALKGNKKRTITLKVTASEPIRTVYASPNSAAKGSKVKLIATTDQTRTAVRFDVNVNGQVRSVNATEKVADNDHGIYTWTGYITADTSGTFDVVASAEKNNLWTTCDNGQTTMFVSSSNSSSETSLNTLRASDDVIKMISLYEGGLYEAEIDPLAYGSVMNYGYGVVISAGETFYNRASMSEYFADLVNQVNERIYSRYVNEFLQENGIKYNQNQFDALVCFVYNLGVYSLQNAGLKSILLDCYEPATLTEQNKNIATVSVNSLLNVRSGAGTNYSIIGTLSNGEQVTILDDTKVNGVWLKVKTSSGLVGYCSSNYLIIGGWSNTRNFNYIDEDELVSELLAWHHAGGNCYWGLLYRRIDELEMFFYADYVQDGSKNKHGWTYPSCIW